MVALALAALAAPVPVEVVQTDAGWTLHRAGAPYAVRGVGGTDPLDALVAIGGNSVRTWGVDADTRDLLDRAHAAGLTVSVGLWLGHARHGFDYGDPTQVADQRAAVLAAVDRLKDHPAVLVWGLGNEMEGFGSGDDPAIWSAVCDLATAIAERDPHHPVMTTTADIGGGRVPGVMACDAIAIHGINSYGGAPSIPERYAAAGGAKPILLTEYGPAGTWEVGRTPFGAVPEQTSTDKAAAYRRVATEVVGHPQVMGGYAFLWGWKVEATSTWYGLYLPDGTRLAGVDALADVWGEPVPNRVPAVTPLVASSDTPDPGAEVTVSWTATDPEGDPLTATWVLRREASTYETGGDAQRMPMAVAGAVTVSSVDGATLRMPDHPGLYRLYAEVRDDHGGGAVASVPFLVGELPPEGAPVPLPWPVYVDAGIGGPWVPSGWMGDTDAIRMDDAWTTDCASPPTCLRVDFTARGGWGGVAWQDPPNDWGEHAGGLDLDHARRLSLRVRGKFGGEVVTLGVGLIGDDKPFPDSLSVEKRVRLTKEWQTVRVPLRGDASTVKTGFRWVVTGQARPLTFFLDDVVFE